MSIQGIKGVEIGEGFENSKLKGSQVHDEIFYNSQKGYYDHLWQRYFARWSN